IERVIDTFGARVNTIPGSWDAKPSTGADSTPPMIVAIDGPSGVGKSTVAKLIAARLGYTYLDSGALYRAVAWKALTAGTDPADSDAIRRLCATTKLTASSTVGGGMVVEVDGQVLGDELRTPEVSRAASQVAALSQVRAWLLPIQQYVARQAGAPGLVAVDRVIGARDFLQAPGFRRAPRAKERRSADRREPCQLPGHPDPGLRDAPAGMVYGPHGPFLRTDGLVDAAHGVDPNPQGARGPHWV